MLKRNTLSLEKKEKNLKKEEKYIVLVSHIFITEYKISLASLVYERRYCDFYLRLDLCF